MNESNLLAIGVVIVTVVFVVWFGKQENKAIKKILDWFPAILFAYVIPASFTHITRIDLATVELHNFSKNWIIPFTILTVMSALSFKELRIVGVKPIIVFVFGSLIIATLPVALVWLSFEIDSVNQDIFLTQEYWKGLVPIVGG